MSGSVASAAPFGFLATSAANALPRGNTAKAAAKARENLCRISDLHAADSPRSLISEVLRASRMKIDFPI